jgi:Zn-dependent peptidase ImmA (M78 family)
MDTRKIAKDYGLNVVHVNKNNIGRVAEKYDIDKKNLKNNAYVIDNEDIILGIFDDKDLKIASFFHEIGHTLIKESFEKLVNENNMLIESQAWIEGLRIAKKYGVKFSDKMFNYIMDSINTYYIP